jgi:hypothetical protein
MHGSLFTVDLSSHTKLTSMTLMPQNLMVVAGVVTVPNSLTHISSAIRDHVGLTDCRRLTHVALPALGTCLQREDLSTSFLPRMESLHISVRDCAQLLSTAQATSLLGLRELAFKWPEPLQIVPPRLLHAFRHNLFPSLTELNLCALSEINDAFCVLLPVSCPRLAVFLCRGADLTDSALVSLSSCRQLESITVTGTSSIGGQGLKALAACERLSAFCLSASLHPLYVPDIALLGSLTVLSIDIDLTQRQPAKRHGGALSNPAVRKRPAVGVVWTEGRGHGGGAAAANDPNPVNTMMPSHDCPTPQQAPLGDSTAGPATSDDAPPSSLDRLLDPLLAHLAPHLRSLVIRVTLDRSLTKADREASTAFERYTLPQLRTLELMHVAVTDTFLSRVSRQVPRLISLAITDAPITSRGVSALQAATWLRRLHLGACRDVGAINLPGVDVRRS